MSKSKRKTLIDVNLATWAGVKHFATIRNLATNDAVQILLRMGLSKSGYENLNAYTKDVD